MARTTIVIPCYNEASRLCGDAFVQFAKAERSVRFLFVNDGSTDSTPALLRALEQRDAASLAVIDLPVNRGKAEAVRVGMLAAIDSGADYAGYWDADLATPLGEIPRFVEQLETSPTLEIVFGARVQLLGRTIERNPLRHYLGRIFATVASLALELPVYDTQCGAKLFRVSGATRELFATSFLTNWVFDVEILARLRRARHGTALPAPRDVIYEYPLRSWTDVAGSKVGPLDFVRALFEMVRIRRHYLRRLR